MIDEESEEPEFVFEPGLSAEALAEEFLYWVGLCITEWAIIDEDLFHCCLKVFDADPQHVAIVYYRLSGLEARIALTDELVLTVLPQRDAKGGGHDHAVVKEWRALKEAIRDANGIRRQLAHNPRVPMMTSRTEDQKAEYWQFGWALFMSDGESFRKKGKPKMLGTSELKSHMKVLADLRRRLDRFRYVALPAYCRPPRAPSVTSL